MDYKNIFNTKRRHLSYNQLACNILRIFAECSPSVAMFRATRERLGNMFKENIFKETAMGKSFLCEKCMI